MAHEIEITSAGASTFVVGTPAWHRQGIVLDSPPTIEEGLKAAGLDWDVKLQPVYAKLDGEEIPTTSYATIRSTDKKVLGVVGNTYKPLQNADAFKWFQPFLDSGVATLESAGSLRGGKRVWVMAKLKGDPLEVVKGDTVERYMLLSNGHDGTLAIRAGFSAVRVVCANTMAQAHTDANSKLLKIRHTGKAVEGLEAVREIMDAANATFEASVDQFRKLAGLKVDKDDLRKYVKQVFRPKIIQGGALDQTEEVETDCDRLVGKILPLFEKGRGNDMDGVAGTAWAMYNGLNEYLAYERGSSDIIRLDSLWYGDSARLNQRALDTALAMVG